MTVGNILKYYDETDGGTCIKLQGRIRPYTYSIRCPTIYIALQIKRGFPIQSARVYSAMFISMALQSGDVA